MFILSLLLFVGGMALLGLAISLPVAPGVFFALGILVLSLGIALPIHYGGTPGAAGRWSISRKDS